MDPKQRMAMEVTYEALENANLSLQDVWGTQTTCYIGSAVSDYRDSVIRDFMQNPKYHLLGTGEEMISNRISHFLNIHGPSATVATACSSSLMSTHMAVQSIKSGEADMAITGGVGLMLTPDFTTVSLELSKTLEFHLWCHVPVARSRPREIMLTLLQCSTWQTCLSSTQRVSPGLLTRVREATVVVKAVVLLYSSASTRLLLMATTFVP